MNKVTNELLILTSSFSISLGLRKRGALFISYFNSESRMKHTNTHIKKPGRISIKTFTVFILETYNQDNLNFLL